MKKELLFVFLVSVIIFSSIGIHAATTGLVPPINPGHNSTQVFISVGNGYITLQDAVDNGYFVNRNSSVITRTLLPVSSPYHLASQILINVTSGGNIYTMTLQQAADNRVFVSGATRSYQTTLSAGGEYYYNINVNTLSGIVDLRNAINNNLISSILPPFCQGKPVGTSCGANLACDGGGNCLGWAGLGCAQCPFGSQLYTPSCPGRPLVCPQSYNYCVNPYNPGSVSAECSYLGDCPGSCPGRQVFCPPCTFNVNWVMVP